MTKAANFADYGLGVGIQSAGSVISGVGVTQLNFIGTGNTFRVSGGTVDISISAGAGSTQWITNNTGIVTTSKVAIGTDNARYQLEVSNSGVAGTALWVTGDARITGILSIGTGTITLDGSNNIVNIGTGVTIFGSSGIISATSFVGNGSGLTGAGSTVTNDTSTNATYYPLFTQTTSGTVTSSGVSTSKLSFNPSTGTLSATKFSGDGSGLTGAGSTVADDISTNSAFYPVFTSTTTGTITASKVSTTKLSFNPSTGTLNSTVLSSNAGTFGSNGTGTRTIQSGGTASGGSSGDIYYIY